MNSLHVRTTLDWCQANQRYLVAAMHVVSVHLRRHAARATGAVPNDSDITEAGHALEAVRQILPAPAALERLSHVFGLSSFESMVLLLCAAVELDSTFGPLCAAARGDPQRGQPTFGLALAALPGAHWSALTPAAPLRRWRLVELGSGAGLTASPLRIDERILHYLTGVDCPDERVSSFVDAAPVAVCLAPSQREVAARLTAIWSLSDSDLGIPIIQLSGHDAEGLRQVAAAACASVGRTLRVVRGEVLPTALTELVTFCRLWNREASLCGYALMVDCGDRLDRADSQRWDAVARLSELVQSFLVVATRDRWTGRRRTVSFEVPKPSTVEQRAIWFEAIGSRSGEMDGHVERLVGQFSLGTDAIKAACLDALSEVARLDIAELSSRLWDACRQQARPRFDDLAQRIDSAAGWEDLVLPEAQRRVLRDVTAHVRQRARVYETWGFAAKGSRGLGITALFAGSSGTGKTMAAEVIARELRLDLYRIDLSAVVSKYIGETEKNLRRIFDAAEDGGAVLLFDEADALFGKRSEVKDSHDRYANIEVSYLLQRMEAYRGLAILTTNMKAALDPAFLRRIRFVVQFPFPDTTQRTEIWRRVFPGGAPTRELDFAGLARLSVPGGNIKNIALGAAFLAADAGQPIQMQHVLRAAQTEYAKLEKPLTDAEVGAWAPV